MSRIKHAPSEVRRLLELRLAEKLTFNQVSERFGIPVHVLTHRATQDRKAKLIEKAKLGGFVEFVAAPQNEPAAIETESGIEILLSGGARIRLDRHFDEATLSRLLSITQC